MMSVFVVPSAYHEVRVGIILAMMMHFFLGAPFFDRVLLVLWWEWHFYWHSDATCRRAAVGRASCVLTAKKKLPYEVHIRHTNVTLPAWVDEWDGANYTLRERKSGAICWLDDWTKKFTRYYEQGPCAIYNTRYLQQYLLSTACAYRCFCGMLQERFLGSRFGMDDVFSFDPNRTG